MDLPDEYIPTELQSFVEETKVRPLVYGIGIQHTENEIGMVFGPNPDVMKMLEFVPEDETSNKNIIIRFNKDCTETILYRWDKFKWVKEDG